MLDNDIDIVSMAVMAPHEHWLLGHRRHTSTSSIGGVVGCLGAMPEPNPSPTGSGSILLQRYRPLAYGMRLAQVREPCRGDCRDGGSEAGDDPHCDSRKPSLDDIWLWKPRVPFLATASRHLQEAPHLWGEGTCPKTRPTTMNLVVGNSSKRPWG